MSKTRTIMTYKKEINELISALNDAHGTDTALKIESGCYWLCNADGTHHNPFSVDGLQPTRSGTGIYLYLLGLTDGLNL